MQKGGGERKTSSCWLYKSIESELVDFISYMAHVPKRARSLVILRMESQDKLWIGVMT